MWKDLTLEQKAEIMKMSVANGVTDINDIQQLYDGSVGHRFDDAGRIRTITTSGNGYIPPIKQEAIIDAAFDYATGNRKIPIDVVRKRLYDNLYPYSYTSPVTRVHNAVVNNRKEPRIVRNIPDRDDIFAEYLQIPENERHHLPGTMYVRDSEYAPTIGGTNNVKYKKLDLTDAQKEKIILATNSLNFGENRLSKIKHKFDEAKSKPRKYTDTQAAAMVLNSYFGEYTLGKGLDPQKGEYRSYYDLWDLSPVSTYGKDETRGIGKPVPFYDRIYLSDYYGVEPQLLLPPKGDYFGKWLPEIIVTNKKALGGHKFDDAGRIITLADLPREYVQRYGHINVVTPKGVRMPLSQAYRDYNQTPINVNDVPGLTDYLIKQDNPDIQEQAHINKVAADRFVHQLGEERDKALIGLAAAITGGGALASGLALAPVATISSTIGGIAGEKAFNAGYEKLTGNNWGQDVERWTNGYIPAEYGEYLNPGALVGGVAAEPLRKFVGRNAYKGFLNLPQTKRAVEVAMRTTDAADPIRPLVRSIKNIPNTKETRQNLLDVSNYILTGKRQETRPYRRLLGDTPNTGFFGSIDTNKKDIIDAYLYGEQVDPSLLKLISKGNDFGIHTDYVSQKYPHKAKNIQVYEGDIGGYGDVQRAIKEVSDIGDIIQQKGITGYINALNDYRYDAAGHIVARDALDNRIEQDIYKFNAEEYYNKWINERKEKLFPNVYTKEKGKVNTFVKDHIITPIIKGGLKIVDDIGTPVIVRSKPYRYKTLEEMATEGVKDPLKVIEKTKEGFFDDNFDPDYFFFSDGGYLFSTGGHLYKNAGPLNKKQAPKYRYGLIEQALVEGGAGGKFRVTSGKRKPNEAGNKGNSSAHTYTLENGDPAAIDIVPVGISGQELLDIMASPLMQATLSKYGFDILNESSKEMMAKNAATGQHLHVGKGIKGQQGKGQIFGGSTWGTLGRTTGGVYASSGNPTYTSIPSSSTQTSEPFGVKAPKDEVNPWVKFLAEVQQSTRPASPAQEEESTPTLTAQSNLTDFSSLNTDPRVEEAIQQANSQPALAYMPDITSDPLWNDSYDLFEPNTLANGGHLLRRGGPYDIEARSDNTANVVRPVNRMIQIKQQDTPARRKKETREYKARQERAKYTPVNPRQANIGPYREKTALDKQGGRLYAEAEQRRKDAEDREAAGAVLNALIKPIMPSTGLDIYDAYKRGEINNVTDALAAPYLTGSWSQRNPDIALGLDLAAPFAVAKGTQLLDKGTRGLRLARAMNKGLNEVPENYSNIVPKVRTRIGDVEINNPQLMYHQKEGTNTSIFGKEGTGSILNDNGVSPGNPKLEGQPGYIWFNKGKPYVNRNSQYLVTTNVDNPNLMHVRSQNYPIGQWDGEKGFVTNNEYVSANPVSGSVYTYEPGYGYRRVNSNPFEVIPNSSIQPINNNNAASMSPANWDWNRDIALFSGDRQYLQKLRDLHSYMATGIKPKRWYHGTQKQFYKKEFDPDIEASTWEGSGNSTFLSKDRPVAEYYAGEPSRAEKAHMSQEDLEYALAHAGKVYEVYPNVHNTKTVDYKGASWKGTGTKISYTDNIFGDEHIIPPNTGLEYFPFGYYEGPKGTSWITGEEGIPVPSLNNLIVHPKYLNYRTEFITPSSAQTASDILDAGYDAAILKNINEGVVKDINGVHIPTTDIAVRNPRLLKLADALTFDDKGNLIPLSARDNFTVKDFRWKMGGTLRKR